MLSTRSPTSSPTGRARRSAQRRWWSAGMRPGLPGTSDGGHPWTRTRKGTKDHVAHPYAEHGPIPCWTNDPIGRCWPPCGRSMPRVDEHHGPRSVHQRNRLPYDRRTLLILPTKTRFLTTNASLSMLSSYPMVLDSDREVLKLFRWAFVEGLRRSDLAPDRGTPGRVTICEP